MKWALWNTIKVVMLWVVCSVLIGGGIFLLAKTNAKLINDRSLDVERPTKAPASTVATTKEPVVVIVPAATNEPRYAAANLYAKSGVVVSVNVYEDVVRFVDTRGAEWEFYGVEDWQVGDRLCAIFDDASTLNPYDDAVIRATYEAWDY